MKTIILLSSIFYFLGLKIGDKIDLVKKSIPIEKIIIQKLKASKPVKSISFDDAVIKKSESDTLQTKTPACNAVTKCDGC